MALKLIRQAPPSEAKWVNFDDDTKILLAGIDNAEYQIAFERMQRRIRRNDSSFEEGEVGVLAGEKSQHESQCMLISHFILKDWDGVLDAEGNPLKFSHNLGCELLKSNFEFFVFVFNQSTEIAREAKEELAETVGKPSPASNGKGSGRASPKRGVRSTSA